MTNALRSDERLLHRFLWLTARIGTALVLPLSRSSVLALGRCLGRCGYRLLGRDRAIARANLEMAYGTALTRSQREAVIRESFGSFTRAILDSVWFLGHFSDRIRQWVQIEKSLDHWTAKGPVIAVTAHLGNWELLGQVGAFLGAPPLSVAARSRNPAIDRFFAAQREKNGMRIVWREGAMRALRQELAAGGRVALVLDQHIRPSEGAAWIRFFGRQAAMSPAAALLAQRFEARVLPAFCLALPDGRYQVFAHEPLPYDGAADINQAIADVFEREIRAHPGQWLWMYKRWKYLPPGGRMQDYPFYARREDSQ